MTTVGAYEAKTRLAELLDRVAKGERITITRHGVPVAVLSPAEPAKSVTAAEAIQQLQGFCRGRRLGEIPLRQLIEEGRRY
jgi:prevent-host-death family protein